MRTKNGAGFGKNNNGTKNTRCYFCRHRMDCHYTGIPGTGSVWCCGNCLDDRQHFGDEKKNQTPYATNGSPNEGLAVKAMGYIDPAKVKRRRSRHDPKE